MKNRRANKKITPSEKITRKEALKKGGKYAAFTAAAMLTVLSPKQSQATSPAAPTPWG